LSQDRERAGVGTDHSGGERTVGNRPYPIRHEAKTGTPSKQVRYQAALRPDNTCSFDSKPLPRVKILSGMSEKSQKRPDRDKTHQLGLSVSKPDQPSFAFRFSFCSASLFIVSLICEYFLNTLASPCRSSCVTHSSATPPALKPERLHPCRSKVFPTAPPDSNILRKATGANPAGRVYPGTGEAVTLSNDRVRLCASPGKTTSFGVNPSSDKLKRK
jgi:hypothetical protein